jgi:hypothetical protein
MGATEAQTIQRPTSVGGLRGARLLVLNVPILKLLLLQGHMKRCQVVVLCTLVPALATEYAWVHTLSPASTASNDTASNDTASSSGIGAGDASAGQTYSTPSTPALGPLRSTCGRRHPRCSRPFRRFRCISCMSSDECAASCSCLASASQAKSRGLGCVTEAAPLRSDS